MHAHDRVRAFGQMRRTYAQTFACKYRFFSSLNAISAVLAGVRGLNPEDPDPGGVNPGRGQAPAGVGVKRITRGQTPAGVGVKKFRRGQTQFGAGVSKFCRGQNSAGGGVNKYLP